MALKSQSLSENSTTALRQRMGGRGSRRAASGAGASDPPNGIAGIGPRRRANCHKSGRIVTSRLGGSLALPEKHAISCRRGSHWLLVCLLVAACGQADAVSPEDQLAQAASPEVRNTSAERSNEPADEPSTGKPQAPDDPATKPEPAADGPVPLNPQKTVLLDAARKRVFLKATVVLREGVLEMFACLAGTKEHESIVAVETKAYVIHAALLAVGAEPGKPVQFDPEYRPPQGQPIDIFVNWQDDDGRPYRVPAQYWMRHTTRRYYLEPLDALPDGLTLPEDSELRYDEKRRQLIWFGPMNEQQLDRLRFLSKDETYRKIVQKFFDDSQARQMEADFVFAGSSFYEEEDGTKFYLAESGNLICVANFSDAIIDVNVKSASSNEALMFEPYTERIPPLGTKVTVELVPRFEK